MGQGGSFLSTIKSAFSGSLGIVTIVILWRIKFRSRIEFLNPCGAQVTLDLFALLASVEKVNPIFKVAIRNFSLVTFVNYFEPLICVYEYICLAMLFL